MITQSHSTDIQTPTGLMRSTVYRPVADGRFPAIIFYSEIFQITAPIERTARIMAGFGFIVVVPEIFHELNPIGTVLAYDDAGREKGNADKFAKPLEQHDSDTVAIIEYLNTLAYYTGQVGAMGVCIGGHMSFRAALNPAIKSACCLYPTDIHSNSLPAAAGNNSIDRCAEIKGELLMIWGKQDPHIPTEGRLKVYHALTAANLNFTWHEFNGQHAFMRDEGERYDAELALTSYRLAVDFFRRTLAAQ